jgi:hypothetical protein
MVGSLALALTVASAALTVECVSRMLATGLSSDCVDTGACWPPFMALIKTQTQRTAQMHGADVMSLPLAIQMKMPMKR